MAATARRAAALLLVCCLASVGCGEARKPPAEPPIRPVQLKLTIANGRSTECRAMPGQWIRLPTEPSFLLPYTFPGETELTFETDGFAVHLLRKGKPRQLVGVDIHIRTGLIALDDASRQGTSPLTVACRPEQTKDFPPLPRDGALALCLHRVSDLAPLARVPHVSALWISGGPELAELAPLGGLTRLKSLVLHLYKTRPDLAPLARLTDLEHLTIGGCRHVDDASFLKNLTKLRSLSLSSPKNLADLSPLSGMHRLVELRLWGVRKPLSLTPLAKLTRLLTLDLRHCTHVRDLAALSHLAQLESLSMEGCATLSDLTPLTGLTSLRELSLTECPNVRDLAPLGGLRQLQRLTLYHCRGVRDVSPLAKLPQLRQMILIGCPEVRDLWSLQAITRRHRCRLFVDDHLRAQAESVAAISPSKVNVITDGHFTRPLGPPLDYLAEPGLWVRLRSPSPPKPGQARRQWPLVYPVSPCAVGTVLRFERKGHRMLLSTNGGPLRLAGVHVASAEGVAALRLAIEQGTSPLIIWAEPDLIGSLPPLPEGKRYTLVVMGGRRSLKSLRGVKHLTGLCFPYGGAIASDLAPLAHLTGLETLWIDSTPTVTSLAYLSKMTRLKALRMMLILGVDDLEPLAELTSLRTLGLLCREPYDFSPLAKLPELKVLRLLAGPDQADISSLGKLQGLEALDLTLPGDVADLAPLANLTRLKVLDLLDCGHVADLSPLAKLQRLEALSLAHCDSVADITPLTHLPTLRWLRLSRCEKVTDAATLLRLERRGVELSIDLRLQEAMRRLRK